jgi:DNA processing protein
VTVSSTGAPGACDPCLRRLHLLGLLAPYIERGATGNPGRRSPQLLALSDADLIRAVGGRKAERLAAAAAEIDPGAVAGTIAAVGCWAVCSHDRRYPSQLRDLGDAPPALVGRGGAERLALLRPEATVTVVGARRATSYGREQAGAIAAELAAAGFAVVSGLAWGVDGAAHQGAVERGFTAAVLGCGADVAYPRHHCRLYERIGGSGLILSELPPGTPAWRWAFPARNRIMAALGTMTIVVEAAAHSGSLITAELATDLGRDVGAVPGPVGARMSIGTNQLLADGARLVRGAQDVLDALIGPGAAPPPSCGPSLDGRLGTVLDRVEEGDRDSDSIALALACGGAEATASLARLERLGYLQRSFAGTYSRTSLTRPGSPTL